MCRRQSPARRDRPAAEYGTNERKELNNGFDKGRESADLSDGDSSAKIVLGEQMTWFWRWEGFSCRIEDVAIVHVYAQLSMITDGFVARAKAEIGGHALTSMSAHFCCVHDLVPSAVMSSLLTYERRTTDDDPDCWRWPLPPGCVGAASHRRAGLPGSDGHRPRGGYQARAPIRADSEGLESHAA